MYQIPRKTLLMFQRFPLNINQYQIFMKFLRSKKLALNQATKGSLKIKIVKKLRIRVSGLQLHHVSRMKYIHH
jgi:hypothetical protein